MRTFLIYSSHGELSADVDTGDVVSSMLYVPVDPEAKPLLQIARFDVDEWERHYGRPPALRIDILDLGYWLHDGTYEPPVHDWRAEFRAPQPA